MQKGVAGAAIAQFSSTMTTFCMNQTLMTTYDNIGNNAFSVISCLFSFTMSVFFCVLKGLQSLFGQAYGAQQEEDLRASYHIGQIITVAGSALYGAVYLLFPIPCAVCSVQIR